MATYRAVPEVPGAVGSPVSAADIDMDSMTGTCTVVEPGWESDKSWKYSDGAFSTKTTAFAAHMEGKTAFKIESPPSAPCRFMRFENDGGTQVASLRMETDGRLTLIRVTDQETTQNTYIDVWVPYTIDINQDAGECVVRLYNRLKEHQETLRIPIGAQDIVEHQEGVLDTSTGMELIVSETELGTDPLYMPLNRPNIVYITFDDAPAQAYLKHMSAVTEMITNGALLSRHFVATPLCAPSRACMITGKYGQNNGVVGNGGATDDWLAVPGNERNSLYARMSDINYRIMHAGKFLHGYEPTGNDSDHTDGWKPTGVDWGLISSDAYQQFDYVATDNRDGDWTLVDTTGGSVDDPPEDHYFQRKITAFCEDFLDDHYDRYPGRPFMMFIAPYAGHNNVSGTDPEDPGGPKYPADPDDRPDGPDRPPSWPPPEFPATGDLGDDPPSGMPDYPDDWDTTNFNVKPSPLPGWMSDDTMSPGDLADLDVDYLDVIRQMQSPNDMIIAIKAALSSYGALNDTVFIVTSDNGYNRGEHGLRGKGDIYDQACRLPIVVEGPGVAAGQTVEALLQNIDLLPTCLEIAGVIPDERGVTADDVDGFSWWGRVTGNPPVVERQTAFCRYESGNVGSWEEALGTDEPPDWVGLISANGDRFVTFDTANLSPPEANRAEAYSTSVDPGMLANLYPTLPQYRSWPVMALLQVLLGSEGQASRDAQLQGFTFGAGERAITDGPQLAVDCSEAQDGTAWLDLKDPAGRWVCIPGTTFPTLPEPIYADVGFTGDGTIVSDDQFDTTTSIGAGFGKIALLVRDYDEQGNHGGSLQLGINKSAVLTPFARRGVWRLGERPYPGQPVQWATRARRVGSVSVDAPAESTTDHRADIPYQMVDGIWTSPIDYTWTQSPWFGPNPGTYHIYTLAGSQAPVCPIIRVKGTVGDVNATDATTGLAMTWNGSTYDRGGGDFGLLAGEWLLINCATWAACIVDEDTWEITDDPAVSSLLDGDDPSGVLWRLQPVMYGGDPADRRCQADFTGSDRSSSTVLQVRAPKTRYA